MLRRSALSLVILAGCLSFSAASTASAQAAASAQASPETIRSMVAARLDATVIVKFIMKSDDGSSGSDSETEVIGTMIDAKGLVLLSNTSMGGMASRFGGGMTPTDLKVLIGDDTKGLEAKLIARDSELDLCWVQINTPAEIPFKNLDITAPAVSANTGDFLYTVTKGGKFYDRTPIAREIRMIGKASKPRDLMLVGSEGFPGFGMPVYNNKGDCVGFTALILPSEDEMANARDLFGDNPSFAILPLSEVAKATVAAREQAAKPADIAPTGPAALSGPADAASSADTKPVVPAAYDDSPAKP